MWISPSLWLLYCAVCYSVYLRADVALDAYRCPQAGASSDASLTDHGAASVLGASPLPSPDNDVEEPPEYFIVASEVGGGAEGVARRQAEGGVSRDPMATRMADEGYGS